MSNMLKIFHLSQENNFSSLTNFDIPIYPTNIWWLLNTAYNRVSSFHFKSKDIFIKNEEKNAEVLHDIIAPFC